MPIIPSRISETVTITENNTYDVARYTNAIVDVSPNIEQLDVTPTTSAQTITAPSGIDGYSPVNVSAVTSSIDANITAENIKKDVTILGVMGSYEGGGSGPAHYIEKAVDANGKLVNGNTVIDLTGVTDVGDGVLAGAYKNNEEITGSVDLSDLTTISGDSACVEMFNNSMVTGFDLSALTTISGSDACNSMFNGVRITSANLPALTTISGDWGCSGMFQNTSMLTSANLPALTTISGDSALSYIFYNCPQLTTVYIGGTTAINFGTYTNQFDSMFSNCSQNIDVYAPAASQSEIEAMSGYPNFGGTGTVTWHWR